MEQSEGDEGSAGGSATVCWKDTKGRGVGKIPDTCPPPQEKNGALCYPPCKAGYYGVGPVCWESCPAGYINEGALCREKGSIKTIVKKTYGRGAGSLMHCAAGLEEDAGLCYPPCPDSSYSGVGPLCWEGCPTANPINGGALCCTTQGVCTKKIIALSTDMPRAIADAIINAEDPFSVISDAKNMIDAILGFVMPLCDKV